MIFATPNPTLEEEIALARIEELRRELRHYVAEPKRWVGQIRRVLAARAIQGSNSIEGYDVSVEDAVAAIEGDEPSTASEEDWQAAQGYQTRDDLRAPAGARRALRLQLAGHKRSAFYDRGVLAECGAWTLASRSDLGA